MPTSSRRRFFKAAALGAVATATTATASHAQGEPRPTRGQAEALAEIARQRFGRHLNEAQMKSVQQRLSGQLATGEQLKRTRMTNADEPAFVFVPEE